ADGVPLGPAQRAGADGDPVGCVALRDKDPGSYVVAAGTRVGLLDWDSQDVQCVAQLDGQTPGIRVNDGKVDPAGRFMIGTMPEPLAPGVWEPAQGALYSLHGDHAVRKLADRLGISNGLDWSPDQRMFYHVDSLDYAVYVYDYDVQADHRTGPTGRGYRVDSCPHVPSPQCPLEPLSSLLPPGPSMRVHFPARQCPVILPPSVSHVLTCPHVPCHFCPHVSRAPPSAHTCPCLMSSENRQLLLQLPRGGAMPDGLCVDSAGSLWVACIDGGRVIRVDPHTGSRVGTLEFPVSRVTSCCFGGADYADLFVTSAADGLSAEQLRGGGGPPRRQVTCSRWECVGSRVQSRGRGRGAVSQHVPRPWGVGHKLWESPS
ncbi:regucalcin-like, partial [Onychomys torridus]|uniref:regucalcin-like n=1 Tax=Onychomys torridus TaxID=38674 RepID=UPI00167F5D5A